MLSSSSAHLVGVGFGLLFCCCYNMMVLLLPLDQEECFGHDTRADGRRASGSPSSSSVQIMTILDVRTNEVCQKLQEGYNMGLGHDV